MIQCGCVNVQLIRQETRHTITHMQTCTVYCYVKMFCVAMIEEKKKHFNKCLITSLDSDSVHDSNIARLFGNQDISHVNIF